MNKTLLLFTGLCCAPLLHAQKADISPPLAGAVSNNQTAFVIGKIYVEPTVKKVTAEKEAESVIEDEQTTADLTEKKLLIYPNPVDSNLYFFAKNQEMPKTVTIYESGGRLVFSGEIKNNTINIGSLTTGSYLLQTNLDPVQQYTILKN